jgi:hypothetical protein
MGQGVSPWDEATHAPSPLPTTPRWRRSTTTCWQFTVQGARSPRPHISTDGHVETWIASFLEKAHPYPQIWPLNPYHSVSVDSPALVESFLAATRGQVWFSEVGGVVWWRFKGRLIEHGEAYAARVAKNIFQLVKLSPRITRVYYYHWRSPGNPRKGAKKATWDAGLVRSNGAARPALYVVAKELNRYFQKSIPKIF